MLQHLGQSLSCVGFQHNVRQWKEAQQQYKLCTFMLLYEFDNAGHCEHVKINSLGLTWNFFAIVLLQLWLRVHLKYDSV